MNATPPAEHDDLRELLEPLVEELKARLRRRVGVRYLLRRALALHRAGAEGFAQVSPLDLALEFLPLGRDACEVLDDLYGAYADGSPEVQP